MKNNPFVDITLTQEEFVFLNGLEVLLADFNTPNKCNGEFLTIQSSVRVCVDDNQSDESEEDTSPVSVIVVFSLIGLLVAIAVYFFFVFRRRKGVKFSSSSDSLPISSQNSDYSSYSNQSRSQRPYPVAVTAEYSPPTAIPWSASMTSKSVQTLYVRDIGHLRMDEKELKMKQMLCRGGYGTIWLADYCGSKVAVKKLLLATATSHGIQLQFASEIQEMNRIEHPNIVQFIGAIWNSPDSLSAVSEYMEGGDLQTLLLDSRVELHWEDKKFLFAVQIMYALVYLHSLQPTFIHRNLKSNNILLTAGN